MDEFGRIRHWTGGRVSDEWAAARGVALGIGDDAAVVDPMRAKDGIAGGKRLLLSMDTMVQTVHFNGSTMRDADIGYKALAANVSDIAAMGGVPLHALVSVSVPPSFGVERMRAVFDGLYECAERYGVAIVGGDTTAAPEHLVVTVALTGTVETERELLRSGAKPGDVVFVTGPIGMSAAGLHMLQSAAGRDAMGAAVERPADGAPPYASLAAAHRRPAPSVRAGRLLNELGCCRSLNDVSDGLASEAWEIAEASLLRLVLEERLLPKSGKLASYASEAGVDPLEWMLYGGEDYVLLGTMARADAETAKAAFNAEGLPFYVVGETEAGEPGVELARSGDRGEADRNCRQSIPKRGYNHFSNTTG